MIQKEWFINKKQHCMHLAHNTVSLNYHLRWLQA